MERVEKALMSLMTKLVSNQDGMRTLILPKGVMSVTNLPLFLKGQFKKQPQMRKRSTEWRSTLYSRQRKTVIP